MKDKERYHDDFYMNHYQYRPPRYKSLAEKTEELEPLLQVLDEYSYLLKDLHESSVSLAKLKRIQMLLKRNIQLGSESFQLLNNREKIQNCMWELDLNIVLEKRRTEFNLPVYYCFEYSNKHYVGDYNLILTDFHRSDYFLLQDTRFVPMTYYFTEKFAMRLSQFHTESAIAAYGDERTAFEKIKQSGESILQAMWDPQQFLAFQCCQYFSLEGLRQAIELIYLINGTNISALRQLVDDDTIKFFEHVYPHPYIVGYLRHIQNLEGREFKTLQAHALEVYATLNEILSNLLNTEVHWKSGHEKQILYKVLFSNLYRLGKCETIKSEELTETVEIIESQIDHYVADLIS